MNDKTQEKREFQWTRWIVGGASLLLLLGAGLELLVRQTLEHHSVATVILAHYLAFWSYVLGLGVLLFFAVWWLVEWGRAQVKQTAMINDASAGSRHQHLEKSELRAPHYHSTIGHGSCCS